MTRVAYIDGLRAIAVVLVLWFHAKLPGIPGGYLGVDIFFVISGFLISGQIYDAIAQARFSIVQFYARRVLRLAPPLLVVLVAVLVAALSMRVLPVDIRRIADSAVASALLVPNWYFKRSDYFAPLSERDPLLHLWSLGVEEQYYLFAPVIIVAIGVFARATSFNLYRVGLVLTLGSMMCSLVAAASVVATNPTDLFFATQFRIWELACGGAAALVPRSGIHIPARIGAIIAFIGLIGVALSPLLDPLVPEVRLLNQVSIVASSTMLLMGGSSARTCLVVRILSNRFVVAIGLISYSLYLWHWPILSFWRLTHLDPPTIIENVIAGILVPFLLAILTFYCVERPVRNLKSRLGLAALGARTMMLGVGASLLSALVAFGIGEWSKHLETTSRYRIYSDADVRMERKCGTGATNSLEQCRLGNAGTSRVVLWGDSHAMSVAPGVKLAAEHEGQSAQLIWEGDCPPLTGALYYVQQVKRERCTTQNERVLRELSEGRYQQATGVIIASSWATHLGFQTSSADRGEQVEKLAVAMERTLNKLSAMGLRILLIGPAPLLRYPAPTCLFLADDASARARCNRPREQVDAEEDDIVAALRAVSLRFQNVRFIDARSAFCDARSCEAESAGEILYRDTNHVTSLGSRLLYEKYPSDFRWVFQVDHRQN